MSKEEFDENIDGYCAKTLKDFQNLNTEFYDHISILIMNNEDHFNIKETQVSFLIFFSNTLYYLNKLLRLVF